MAATSVPTSAVTVVLLAGQPVLSLNADRVAFGHAVWFQNNDPTNAFYLQPIPLDVSPTPILDTSGFKVAAGQFIVLQSSGGDTSLVNSAWQAFQASGGTLTTLTCGRW